MTVINAVVTTLARRRLPRMWAGLLSMSTIASFKVGEGGWVDFGSGRVPREPDPDLTDLDVIVDADRSSLNKRYVVEGETFSWYPSYPETSPGKTLTTDDMEMESDRVLRVSCVLDATEYNDDGTGSPPDIWEIGLFDSDGVMVAYGTFPKETKDGQIFKRDIRIIF